MKFMKDFALFGFFLCSRMCKYKSTSTDRLSDSH